MAFIQRNMSVAGRNGLMKAAVTAIGTVMAAALMAPANAQEITFSEILAAPDDTELNLRYARQQAQAGDLLSASAALERLLYYEPNWDEARLFYAVVLYRLGDLKAAEREIDVLEGRELSPGTDVEYQKYRRQIKQRLQRTIFSGQVSAGFGYDDNVSGLLDEASTAATEEEDTSYNLRARLRMTHDLNTTADVRAVIDLRAYAKFFQDLDFNDSLILSGLAGFEGNSGPYQWTAGGVFRNVDIDGTNYLTEFGAGMSLSRQLTAKLSYTLEGDYRDQNYDVITINGISAPLEEFRSGTKYRAGGWLKYTFSPRLKGMAGLGYEVKRADYSPYEYTGPTLNLALDKFMSDGVYIDLDYIYRNLEYAEPDPNVLTVFVGTPTREDERHFLRGALGLPLSTFFTGNTAEARERLETNKIELVLYHDQRQSNYDVYEYENTGAEINYVWRFRK